MTLLGVYEKPAGRVRRLTRAEHAPGAIGPDHSGYRSFAMFEPWSRLARSVSLPSTRSGFELICQVP
jgi:hypothetical protein